MNTNAGYIAIQLDTMGIVTGSASDERNASLTEKRGLSPIFMNHCLYPVFIRPTWAAALMLLLAGCGSLVASPLPSNTAQRGDLVSITSTSTLGLAEINANILTLANTYQVDTTELKGSRRYNVSLRRIVYKTVTPDGRLIDASGLMAYPLKPAGASSPLLSYQHKTLFTDAEVPSSFGPNRDAVLLLALAGSGFIVTMPDYIGYMSSTNEMHTYMHAQGLAAATVDMLRAARHLLAQNRIATNDQLFLTGFSEGGYATLATQKEMEQNLPAEFRVTASMPAAGPYDMSGWTSYFSGASNGFPPMLSFVLVSYDRWYGWNRINDIYQSPYNNIVASLYDGTKSYGEIGSKLTMDSTALFSKTFRDDFLGSGKNTIKTDIAKNDLYNWKPLAPTRLFHGRNDLLVPYSNSTTALAAMKKAGSTSVTLVDCRADAGGLGHNECEGDYLSQVIRWFTSIALNL